eukprot:10787650-Lingulodinium_polyedra.AAC.1
MHARGAAPSRAGPHHAMRACARPREACLVSSTLWAPGVQRCSSDVRKAQLVHVMTAPWPDRVVRRVEHRA